MEGRSIDGSTVYAIAVECEHRRIVLFSEYHDEERCEYTDVVFSDVVAHWFDHVLPGNVLFGIYDWDLDQLVQHEWERFDAGRARGWPPLEFADQAELLAALRDERCKAFNVDSSYGMTGWVVARAMTLVPRERRWPGLPVR